MIEKPSLARIDPDMDALVTVIPDEVMAAIGAKPGDRIVWRVEDGVVTIRKHEAR